MRSAEESAVALFKRAVASAQPQQKIGSEKEQRSREKRKKQMLPPKNDTISRPEINPEPMIVPSRRKVVSAA